MTVDGWIYMVYLMTIHNYVVMSNIWNFLEIPGRHDFPEPYCVLNDSVNVKNHLYVVKV